VITAAIAYRRRPRSRFAFGSTGTNGRRAGACMPNFIDPKTMLIASANCLGRAVTSLAGLIGNMKRI
jgi:hypothetical protein